MLLANSQAGLAAPVEGAPVNVYVLLPLSGPNAFSGQSAQVGLKVLEEHVNATGGIRNRPLHFVFGDDHSSPQVAIQLINAVPANVAHIVLGPFQSATCKAVQPVVEQNGPVAYCLSPAVEPKKGSFMFTGGIQPADTLQATLTYFKNHGWSKVAFLSTIDATGAEHDTATYELFKQPENRGLQLVALEHFAPSDVSVTAQISKIGASGAQALVINAVGSAFATAFRAIKDAGLDIPVAATNSIMLHSTMNEYKSVLPKRLYFAATKWPAYSVMKAGPVRDQLTSFYRSFSAAGIEPDMADTLAWDPGLIAVAALRAAGPDASMEKIRDFIEGLHDFAGTSGMYDFRAGDQRGQIGVKDATVSLWVPEKNAWIADGK